MNLNGFRAQAKISCNHFSRIARHQPVENLAFPLIQGVKSFLNFSSVIEVFGRSSNSIKAFIGLRLAVELIDEAYDVIRPED